MNQTKKKEGLSRLFEIAGQKKGLLVMAGVLSAGSAVCMLVPYWAVYEVLKELLTHGGNPAASDGAVMIRWGWIAFGGLVGGLRTGIAVCRLDVFPHCGFPHTLWIACPPVRTHRQASVGVSEQHVHRGHQENDGPEHRKDRGVHRPYHSGLSERGSHGGGDACHLLFARCVADGRMPSGCSGQSVSSIL